MNREKRGGHNRKVTPAQRDELLQTYAEQGQEAAAELSARYGVGPNYARRLASEQGYRPRYVSTGTLRTRNTAEASA